jgi:hypothetical protein
MKADARPWLDPALPPLPPFSEAESRQIDLYRFMTPLQRWEQAVKLREMAWAIRLACLKKKHPEWSPAELDAAVREFFLTAST